MKYSRIEGPIRVCLIEGCTRAAIPVTTSAGEFQLVCSHHSARLSIERKGRRKDTKKRDKGKRRIS